MKVTLEQGDLFGAPMRTTLEVSASVAARLAERPAPHAGRPHRMTETTLEAGRAKSTAARQTDDARILADIRAAGAFGRTREELAQRLSIKIQSVCWSVARLLRPEDGSTPLACEPVIEYGAKPRHLKRGRSNVVVLTLYRDRYERAAPSVTEQRARGAE